MKAIGHGGPESGVRLELPAPLIVLEALSRFISPQTIRSVLTQTGRHSRRIRRLPAAAVVWPVIAIGIWTDLDIPANATAFGRPRTRRNGQSIEGGYPQIHAIFLSETGTHMVVQAYIKRGKKSEFNVATALLKKGPPGSLVLQDRGFYGYRPLAEAVRRGVHLLARVGKHVVLGRTQVLSDGSYLATIYPSSKDRRHQTNGLVVRVSAGPGARSSRGLTTRPQLGRRSGGVESVTLRLPTEVLLESGEVA